ncbi:MAG: DUF3450 domain-containing protein [Vibrio sp.]
MLLPFPINNAVSGRTVSILKSLALTCCFTASFSTFADALDSARSIENQTNQAAKSAQNTINANSDKTFDLQADIERMQDQIENLSIYQKHLKTLVESQEAEKVSIDNQLVEIKETREGVVPLMYHMIDGLHTLIDQGSPVRLASREKRLEDLQDLMTRADISDAEKYRRILEAYQIEMDYGSKLGVYEGEIQLDADDTRQVDMLYMGKVVLIARSKDAQTAWLWSQADKKWNEMDSSELLNVNQAYALANKDQAPSLLTLPLSVTQVTDETSTEEAK